MAGQAHCVWSGVTTMRVVHDCCVSAVAGQAVFGQVWQPWEWYMIVFQPWLDKQCLVRCDSHESGTWLCFSRGWTSSVWSGVTAMRVVHDCVSAVAGQAHCVWSGVTAIRVVHDCCVSAVAGQAHCVWSGVTAIRVVHDCCVCFSRGWTTNTRCLAGWWRAWRWRRTSATSRCTPRPTSRMTTFASSISPSNDWWQHQNTGRRINFSCVCIINSTVASVALCVICLDSQQNLGDLTIMENIVELANTSV